MDQRKESARRWARSLTEKGGVAEGSARFRQQLVHAANAWELGLRGSALALGGGRGARESEKRHGEFQRAIRRDRGQLRRALLQSVSTRSISTTYCLSSRAFDALLRGLRASRTRGHPQQVHQPSFRGECSGGRLGVGGQ